MKIEEIANLKTTNVSINGTFGYKEVWPGPNILIRVDYIYDRIYQNCV